MAIFEERSDVITFKLPGKGNMPQHVGSSLPVGDIAGRPVSLVSNLTSNPRYCNLQLTTSLKTKTLTSISGLTEITLVYDDELYVYTKTNYGPTDVCYYAKEHALCDTSMLSHFMRAQKPLCQFTDGTLINIDINNYNLTRQNKLEVTTQLNQLGVNMLPEFTELTHLLEKDACARIYLVNSLTAHESLALDYLLLYKNTPEIIPFLLGFTNTDVTADNN